MAVITSGKTFANGEQLSADKLNQVITAATFNSTDAVDNSTIILVGGAMAVRDTGITTAKIADSNVTKAKIENVANMKVLGNTSGGATAPQEVAILDENDMSSDSDTSLATQQSIKAYVDAGDAGNATQIGVGQTWQSVTRALDGTSYTNSTGKPIMVKGAFVGDTSHHTIKIFVTPSGGSEVELTFAISTNTGGNVASNGSIIIPNNTSYKFTKTGNTITSFSFNELR